MSGDDRSGPLRRTLAAMGTFALLAVGLVALSRAGLLDALPSGAGFLAVIAVAAVLAVGVSVYRGEHRHDRQYPLGTGLSQDTPNPSEFEGEEGAEAGSAADDRGDP